MMIYSYSQISQFLSCPRRYRYRYVDGWRGKETRPNVAFGRCFEKAVAAYFLREDSKEVFLREWTACKGWVDGTRTIIDWKTSTCRFPAEPDGVAALDPQLVCYSWITGEPEVALVVFVRKRLPDIQYLRATISDDQRRDFGQLARVTIERIESGEFHPQGDIRSPDNGCTRCSYLGLCLPETSRTEAPLVNVTGGQRGWADELDG